MSALREAVALVVMRWDCDCCNGNWPVDKCMNLLRGVSAPHSGDCTKKPWTCTRCAAEEAYREADDIIAHLPPHPDSARLDWLEKNATMVLSTDCTLYLRRLDPSLKAKIDAEMGKEEASHTSEPVTRVPSYPSGEQNDVTSGEPSDG